MHPSSRRMCVNKKLINHSQSPNHPGTTSDLIMDMDYADRKHQKEVTPHSSPKRVSDRAPDNGGFAFPSSPLLRYKAADGHLPSFVSDLSPRLNVDVNHEEVVEEEEGDTSSFSTSCSAVYLSWPQPFIQTFSSRKQISTCSSSFMTERTMTSSQLSDDTVHSSASTISSLSGSSAGNSNASESSASKRVIFANFWQRDGERAKYACSYTIPQKPVRKGILRKSSYGGDSRDDDSPMEMKSLLNIKQVRFYSNVLCIVPEQVEPIEPSLCWWTPDELKETQRGLVSDLIQTTLGYDALLRCRGLLSMEVTLALNEFYG
mmetsp:Transcript_30144/g.44306  ORF Transcript_30144/g.44306 Transcript_30144/m.44306 type:complete len:318 (+) Transcript_30144:1956-2909(+)